MKIYHYDRNTGELLKEVDARPDPIDKGKYLIPAFATDVAPPKVGENQAACFSDGAWIVKPDHRGATVHNKTTGETVAVKEIGEIDAAYTLKPRPDEFATFNSQLNDWVIDEAATLSDYKERSITANRAEAGNRIASLFGCEYGTDRLRDKQANFQKEATRIILKELRGTITTAERARLAELEQMDIDIDEIRAAENAAAALINDAADIAGVDAVKVPAWPA